MYKIALFSLCYCCFLQVVRCAVAPGGILFPQDSETRQVMSLDGLWNFVLAPVNDPLVGFRDFWFKKDLIKLGLGGNYDVHQMPVPASYNDITTDAKIRDHVGLVWYDRTFFVPKDWVNCSRTWLRFSASSYATQVWINGEFVMNHEMGHLPFQREVSALLNFGGVNRVTVAVDNTLLPDTVPQGRINYIQTDRGKKVTQSYTFDFFNYAGIHRPVVLYTTPYSYIDDITVLTDIDGDTGIVHYKVTFVQVYGDENLSAVVKLIDKEGEAVAQNAIGFSGSLNIPQANFWWPYLMDSDPGYLYTLEVALISNAGELIDIYRLPVGIRTVTWNNTSLMINGRPVYMHGFGRHEDSDIRGKGLDLPTVLRDYNLIKWVGGNAYRTSHYPYAEEIMDMADKLGIMIIDECPGVDTDIFSPSLLEKHKDSLTELIRRDKNRPSVIMWSISNEPRTQYAAADNYFKQVAEHVKSLDKSRPVTIVIAQSVDADVSSKHVDIISFNRYNGWYQNGGLLDTIRVNVIKEATAWHNKHNKPVLMAEYGADTLEGLHYLPSYIWSEEYQVNLLSKHFEAFDELREKGFFIGEFIWNFADFKTAQGYTRVGGNKKGIFTRSRQPKASAHHLRRRYWKLAEQLYNVSVPNDLFPYFVSGTTGHDEL